MSECHKVCRTFENQKLLMTKHGPAIHTKGIENRLINLLYPGSIFISRFGHIGCATSQ